MKIRKMNNLLPETLRDAQERGIEFFMGEFLRFFVEFVNYVDHFAVYPTEGMDLRLLLRKSAAI